MHSFIGARDVNSSLDVNHLYLYFTKVNGRAAIAPLGGRPTLDRKVSGSIFTPGAVLCKNTSSPLLSTG